jgi:transposase-like protein
MGTSNYSDEFKRDAVQQITVRGYPVREVSRRLGVSSHSLYKWIKLFAEPSPKPSGTDHEAEIRRWLNNRAENSYLPLRRRERAMLRFRRMRTLQKFAAVHASVHNHFPTERHLQSRDHYKQTRAAALAERRGLLGA